MAGPFHPGDPVVYRKRKFSAHPGPRAVQVNPAPHGDEYAYSVDKFWRVIAVGAGGRLLVCTRRGKRHTVDAADPALRPASWWERLFWGHWFPAVGAASGQLPQPW